ncbi:MAG: alpha-ketoglutarate-dependent dioxygenase AlkB [Pseudomonadota bacterium]
MQVLPNGVHHIPGYLDRAAQEGLRDAIRTVLTEAPLFTPAMPRTGQPMTVRMSNCGSLGWLTDKERGYRYQAMHPSTGNPWPPIPDQLIALWKDLSGYPHLPEACLINFYSEDAKMGMHQDRDEEDFEAPVLSVSLGDSCRFRIGGTKRGGRTSSIRLNSGDVVILGGEGRLCYHGVDKLFPDTSTLLRNGGRLNLTLRRVTKPS